MTLVSGWNTWVTPLKRKFAVDWNFSDRIESEIIDLILKRRFDSALTLLADMEERGTFDRERVSNILDRMATLS